MKILDLHGTRHNTAEIKVINFVATTETPFKIITGDSEAMRKIVIAVIKQYNYEWYPEHYSNYGAYIIRDKTN
jgi:hypothetical protein